MSADARYSTSSLAPSAASAASSAPGASSVAAFAFGAAFGCWNIPVEYMEFAAEDNEFGVPGSPTMESSYSSSDVVGSAPELPSTGTHPLTQSVEEQEHPGVVLEADASAGGPVAMLARAARCCMTSVSGSLYS